MRESDLKSLAEEEWDVVVIGAGPAGALVSSRLAGSGATVLLVEKDRFPRPKVCGCCLNQRALDLLTDSELGDLVESNGGPRLTGVLLSACGRSAFVGLPGGRALSREVFDQALVDSAVSRGARFIDGVRASLLPPGDVPTESARRVLALTSGSDGARVTAKLVLVADGLSGGAVSRVERGEGRPRHSSLVGAGAILRVSSGDFATGRIEMACGRGGYVGRVRLETRSKTDETDQVAAAAALDPAWIRHCGSISAAVAEIVSAAGDRTGGGASADAMANARWRGTPALSHGPRRIAGYRLLLLGDAAGFVEPFTGQGMEWALRSALAAEPIAIEALEGRVWSQGIERDWMAAHRRVVAKRQRVCRMIAAVLRRERLVYVAVRLLNLWSGLARPLVRHIVGSSRSRFEPMA